MEPILSVSVKFPLSVWPCLRHVQVLHPAAADFVVWMSSVVVLGAGTYALKTHVYKNMYPQMVDTDSQRVLQLGLGLRFRCFYS